MGVQHQKLHLKPVFLNGTNRLTRGKLFSISLCGGCFTEVPTNFKSCWQHCEPLLRVHWNLNWFPWISVIHLLQKKKKETNKQVGRWCKQPVADQKQCERNSIEFFFFYLVVSQKCYDKCRDAMHARVIFFGIGWLS